MILRAGARRLELGGGRRPLLMGILNATPDSFSDGRGEEPVSARLERGRALVAAGADIIDIGGESARGDRPAVSAAEEIARVEELVAAFSKDDVLTSIDTYKFSVAEAAIAAGASIVNDVSGLRDTRLASLCAASGAALVIMHTAVEPKGTLLDPATYADVVGEVEAFLRSRIDVALAAGVSLEQLILDPGPDFAKTPAQTVAVLRRMDVLRGFGRPILLAASRKDFVGAITGRAPAERDPGTLAALAYGVEQGASILRVHDVAGASDFFAVRSVLQGERVLGPLEGLSPERYPDGVPAHLPLG
ncbi:dihydropteroate synthase [Solirubrobacter ginsenosidimutans]|uniref:dihydropteroate synthase n=1 Tax=Solirubrobacter ginsenosidimutans TaxID=490573 RepID=A0A9X3S4Y7_9ACTN|nr:dihydropteroate synthase [Solirubrobacter ginsenosidimutans]MDA0161083.1 dihydropteroate synthase [Solirubrobacter ginsenosidimutans]